MYSEAERAAFAALLDRARANEDISQDEIESVLPTDLATEVIAHLVTRENALFQLYDDEVAANWRRQPPSIRTYVGVRADLKKRWSAAPKKIESLKAQLRATGEAIAEQQALRERSKAQAWAGFEALSDDDKSWAKPSKAGAEWPPEMEEQPPLRVALPKEEVAGAYAVRRVLSAIVDDPS